MKYSLDGLTTKQRERWEKFLALYPQFAGPAKKVFSTAELAEIFGVRSDNVIRTLQFMSRRMGHVLTTQLMMWDRYAPDQSRQLHRG